jgi:hypothetical protein
VGGREKQRKSKMLRPFAALWVKSKSQGKSKGNGKGKDNT